MYNLTKKEKLNFILKKVSELDVSAYDIAKNTPLTEAGVGRILNGTSKNPQENSLNVIILYLESKVLGTNLKENNSHNLLKEPDEKIQFEKPSNYGMQLIECQKETAELYRHVMYLQNLLRDKNIEFNDYFNK